MLGRINNEKGSTLMLVLIGFFVISIFTMTAVFISNANSKRTVKEEHRTKAYYVAQTGAKTFIDHIEKENKVGTDVLKALEKLNGKTSDKEKYYLDKEKTEYGEFDIKVEGIKTIDKDGKEKTESYKIITTGKVREEEVELVAIINASPQFDGGGYKIGRGRVFSNSNEQIKIAEASQLEGAGITLYVKGRKYGNNPPLIIQKTKTDGKEIQDLFTRSNVGKIETLNSQQIENYRLEILEVALDKTADISEKNHIKREKLVKYKKYPEKDTTVEEIQFRYDTDKQDILEYFSKEKLSGEKLTDSQIEEGLKSIFLLPIRSVQDYKDYIAKSEVYPLPNDTFPSGGHTEGAVDADKKTIDLDFRGKKNVKIGLIKVNNAGTVNIKADGGTKIWVTGIETNDAEPEMNKMNIESNGKVDFYIDGRIVFDGHLIAKEGAEVNFYMKGSTFESNNEAIIENVNLYAPNTKVVLNKVDYTGVIVGAQVDFKNQDSTFKAPSSGPDSKEPEASKNSSKINIDWIKK